MTFPAGYDFRATSGFVTDPANCTFEIGTTANYPRTDALGNTVGWEDAPSGTRDRNANAGDAAKVAGVGFYNGGSGNLRRYRIDLPSTGNYSMRCAIGDGNSGSNSNGGKLELFDNVTSLGILVNQGGPQNDNQFYDATNVLRTSPTDWVNNNQLGGPFTFASTILRVKLSYTTASAACIAHLWVESSGGASAAPWAHRFSRVMSGAPMVS